MSNTKPAQARARVWDPVVRLCHWALALTVAAAWLTRHGGGRWHEWLGLAACAIVTIRLLWGWRGTRYAQFSQFVRSPRETLHYARQVLSGREPRYLGHNPLGGWMIVLMLCGTALTAASGWLYTTDRFWGEQWLEEVHSACSDTVITLAAFHILGVAYTSLRHRENLIAAMIHGNKRLEPPAGPGGKTGSSQGEP